MSEGETNIENRPQQFSSLPDGYIRRSTLLQTVGALVGLFGSIFGFYGFIDRVIDVLRTEIRNERIERINADNEIRLQLYRKR